MRASLANQVGPVISALVSTLIVVAHLTFGYAQLAGGELDCPALFDNTSSCPEVAAGNDGLLGIFVKASVQFEATGLVSGALGALEAHACNTSCVDLGTAPSSGFCKAMACDKCTQIGAVTLDQRCSFELYQLVSHVSYKYFIATLWTRDLDVACVSHHEPTCTRIYPGRPAAVALVVFSFIWPHIKLLLMHVLFYVPMRAGARANGNFWLAFFGKWTLTDVLVMCLCIGLMQLTLATPLRSLWHDAEPMVRSACEARLCADGGGFLGGLGDSMGMGMGDGMGMGMGMGDGMGMGMGGGMSAGGGHGLTLGGFLGGDGGPVGASSTQSRAQTPSISWLPLLLEPLASRAKSAMGLHVGLPPRPLPLSEPWREHAHAAPQAPAALTCNQTCGLLTGAVDRVLSPSGGFIDAIPISFGLPMVNQVCMYLFCISVILSISCSVLLEHLEPPTGLPLASHWPATGLPLASHWPPTGLPLAFHGPFHCPSPLAFH